MGGTGLKKTNSKPNQYEWLIVAEGNSDIAIYINYLSESIVPLSFHIISVGGKGYSLNMNSWNQSHIDTIITDVGRNGFKGIIIIVDSDIDTKEPFNKYRRLNNGQISYIEKTQPKPNLDQTKSFWNLDSLHGNNKKLVIRGVNVPGKSEGCMESDILSAYGFPIEPQQAHKSFIEIIKEATQIWKIPDTDDGKPWWMNNEKAKMDKFIYYALRHGLEISTRKKISLPLEPQVITDICAAMSNTI